MTSFAAANDEHVSPVWAWAYLAQGEAIPDWVGEGDAGVPPLGARPVVVVAAVGAASMADKAIVVRVGSEALLEPTQ